MSVDGSSNPRRVTAVARVTAVVRVRGDDVEVVATDPDDPTAPMAAVLTERAVVAAAVGNGLWRVVVELGDDPQVSTSPIGDADAHVVVARVKRTGDEVVVVRSVRESPAGALAPDALARRVSDGVAAATGELRVGESRLVELVASG